MSKLVEIDGCVQCKHVSWSLPWCHKENKAVLNLGATPDWCPRPDKEKVLDVLDACIKAIKALHPVMDENEPCVAYEAWTGAVKIKKMLEM